MFVYMCVCLHVYTYIHIYTWMYNGILLSYKKKNEISLLAITWMETEDESRGYYAK